MTSTTGILVGVAVGLSVGTVFVVALGLTMGVMIRRHWRLKRQRSLDRANLKIWHTDPYSSYLEKTWTHPTGDEENAPHYLYNIPESPAQLPSDVSITATPSGRPASNPVSPTTMQVGKPNSRAAEESVSPRTKTGPMPLLPVQDNDDVRFPAAVSEQAQRPSVQWMRNTLPASLQSGSGDDTSGEIRSGSFKNKMSLSRSISRMQSIRLGSPNNTRNGNRRSVLSRFPSSFRSNRPSRRVTPNSQEEGSIGTPDGQIPMARRIARGQSRFRNDSSSYGSSYGAGDWDEFIIDPAAITEIAVPEPAVLADHRDASTASQYLHERIAAWQESSIDAGILNESPVAKTELSTKMQPSQPQRSATQSTVQSNYSRASANEQSSVNAVPARSSQLLRIPSIRPEFMAETTLDSWLIAEDPRIQAPSSSGHSSGLFAEVEFATANSESAPPSEVMSHARDSIMSTTLNAKPTNANQAPASNTLAAPVSVAVKRLSAHAPRTPSPLGLNNVSQPQPYEASLSSRSSFPASARMSNDLPGNWKHHSNTTASTQLTWPDEASALAEEDPGVALVKLQREPSTRQVAADRVAEANKAWASRLDTELLNKKPEVIPQIQSGPKQTTPNSRSAMPGRFSMESSDLSSTDSVHTEEGVDALSPLATPALGSPITMMQAYFHHDNSQKMDGVSFWSEPSAVRS
ncbi:hypothetical protein MPSI1_002230 [Malassezia psittaci]|uniref:Uncharacterized protein n=1 Tax=Malassezia psittaci TaxID=1821823 RepID=A0AAF0FFA9_9BASI|nr:hypothetical protein MPSI1_002230 [Malassezia psittaci]